MKAIIVKLFGRVASLFYGLLRLYYNQKINRELGGGKRIVQFPYQISGVENIIAGNSINIGKGSTIMTLRAKLIIKGHFISGPKLTIITGDHMPVIGRFIDEVSNIDKDIIDKDHSFDQDVIIEEDVWCGANVTILKGVIVGRGSVIASGSVVTHSIPPYSTVGGIPARLIKYRWNVSEVLEHESVLYNECDRKTLSQLAHLPNS